jgi:hypothetical protein
MGEPLQPTFQELVACVQHRLVAVGGHVLDQLIMALQVYQAEVAHACPARNDGCCRQLPW